MPEQGVTGKIAFQFLEKPFFLFTPYSRKLVRMVAVYMCAGASNLYGRVELWSNVAVLFFVFSSPGSKHHDDVLFCPTLVAPPSHRGSRSSSLPCHGATLSWRCFGKLAVAEWLNLIY